MKTNPLIAPAPLAQTADALRSGELDLLRYIDDVCDRLDAVDDQLQALLPEAGPRERLRNDAHILMQRYPNAHTRPPLYGVPVGVKDIFRVDGFPTRAGSALPPELFEGEETLCVQRLKNAGALILGKTVTTEFAYFEPGPTRNPHNLQHTPGGSSSGSAAAVAAGLTPLALGSQTIGSTIRPAAYCGVVGFKPSHGRIDPTGIIFVAPSLDHVGIFTQDIDGMRLAASVLCEHWRMVKAHPLRVLGVPDGAYLEQATPEGLQAFYASVERLERAGYTVKRIAALDDIVTLSEKHRTLMAGEMAHTHEEWFERYEELYRPRTAAMIRDGQKVDTHTLTTIHEMQRQLRATLEQQMQQEQIDVWICPSAKGTAPEGLALTGDPAMSFPWTFAGMPTVSLPSGFHEGLPLGVQLIAPFGHDEVLLTWARGVAETLQG